jgi:hypothetical protein
MELEEPLLRHPEAFPAAKYDKLTAWDVVYSLNMAIACLITYWPGSNARPRHADDGGIWSA